MFDVGDLPVLTFGNWVLKAEWLSGLWNYMYVFLLFFYVFFKIQKKHDFLRFFELLHTFSRTVPVPMEFCGILDFKHAVTLKPRLGL